NIPHRVACRDPAAVSGESHTFVPMLVAFRQPEARDFTAVASAFHDHISLLNLGEQTRRPGVGKSILPVPRHGILPITNKNGPPAYKFAGACREDGRPVQR